MKKQLFFFLSTLILFSAKTYSMFSVSKTLNQNQAVIDQLKQLKTSLKKQASLGKTLQGKFEKLKAALASDKRTAAAQRQQQEPTTIEEPEELTIAVRTKQAGGALTLANHTAMMHVVARVADGLLEQTEAKDYANKIKATLIMVDQLLPEQKRILIRLSLALLSSKQLSKKDSDEFITSLVEAQILDPHQLALLKAHHPKHPALLIYNNMELVPIGDGSKLQVGFVKKQDGVLRTMLIDPKTGYIFMIGAVGLVLTYGLTVVLTEIGKVGTISSTAMNDYFWWQTAQSIIPNAINAISWGFGKFF